MVISTRFLWLSLIVIFVRGCKEAVSARYSVLSASFLGAIGNDPRCHLYGILRTSLFDLPKVRAGVHLCFARSGGFLVPLRVVFMARRTVS